MKAAKEYHFTITKGEQYLIDALAEETKLSRQTLKDALQKGAVWLKQPHIKKVERFRRAKKLLTAGTEIFFYYHPTILSETIQSPSLIEDHQNFSVWYKPKGVLCQGSKWADHTTINRWIETHYAFPDGFRKAIIVHRLDKATDGLMLIAHNHQTARLITQAFEAKKVKKIYHAWIEGCFPENPQDYHAEIDGKSALTLAKRLQFDSERNRSLIEVTIKTGRKHQIRRHLSSAGYPIIGDRLYPKDQSSNVFQEDLQLTSVYLALTIDGEYYEFRLLDESQNSPIR